MSGILVSSRSDARPEPPLFHVEVGETGVAAGIGHVDVPGPGASIDSSRVACRLLTGEDVPDALDQSYTHRQPRIIGLTGDLAGTAKTPCGRIDLGRLDGKVSLHCEGVAELCQS